MKKQALHPRTESINIKQKKRAKLARIEALRWLAQTFPAAFDTSQQIQPLKIGILNDVLAHAATAPDCGVSKSKLREALAMFTRRIDYLACLKTRGIRIDLYGNPIAEVNDEDADHAAIKIKKCIEKSAKYNKTLSAKKTTTHATSKPHAVGCAHNPLESKQTLPAHHYPSYNPELLDRHATQKSVHKPSIIIKPSRKYDAVARLKEKLGLPQKETTIETN